MTTRVTIRNDSQPGGENSHDIRIVEQSNSAAPERMLCPGQSTEYHLHDGNQLRIREMTSVGPKIDWTEITGERFRTYTYPDGSKFTYEGVCRIEVRASGKHRLETTDGKKAFVEKGWLTLDIDADDWSA